MASRSQNLASAVSIIIALAAAGFSGMQWLEARDQAFLSTKPHVDFDTEDDPDEPMVGIAITNAGPGPALIRSVRHLNASTLIASQPVPIVAQRLGHSRPDVTLRTYSHILPGQDQAAAEAIDAVI